MQCALPCHILQEVEVEQRRLEDEGFALQKELDATAATHDPEERLRHIEKRQRAFAEHVVEEWWAFCWRVVAKYNNGYITTGEKKGQVRIPGYPVWWLKKAGYDKYPHGEWIKPVPSPKSEGEVEAQSKALRVRRQASPVITLAYSALVVSGVASILVVARAASKRGEESRLAYAPLE